MTTVGIDQFSLTLPIPTIAQGRFRIRYAFFPKKEFAAQGIRGEDYLTFRVEGHKMAFAVCDGVGSSFFGGIASQAVGEILVGALWNFTNNGELSLEDSIVTALSENKAVIDSELDRKNSEMRTSLQKHLKNLRKEVGSQSNFVCGLIDLSKTASSDAVSLFCLGDAGLRVYRSGFDKPSFILAGSSGEAWSSRHGLRGKVLQRQFALTEVVRILAYSDGLDPTVQVLDEEVPDEVLAQAIENAQASKDDDISLLEIRLLPVDYDTKDEIGPRIRDGLASYASLAAPADEKVELNEQADIATADGIKKQTPLFVRGLFYTFAAIIMFGLGMFFSQLRTQSDLVDQAQIVEDVVATVSASQALQVHTAVAATLQAFSATSTPVPTQEMLPGLIEETEIIEEFGLPLLETQFPETQSEDE